MCVCVRVFFLIAIQLLDVEWKDCLEKRATKAAVDNWTLAFPKEVT